MFFGNIDEFTQEVNRVINIRKQLVTEGASMFNYIGIGSTK